jgi:hypothetical protein
MPDLSPDVERELEAIDDALAGRRVASELTELGELALLLREDRPEPTEDFGRDLDRRVRLGFPKGDPSVRASGRRWFAWQGWMAPVIGAAATVLVIAAMVSSSNVGEDDDGGGGSEGVAMMEESAGGGAAADDAAGGGDGGGAERSGSNAEEPDAALAPGTVPPAPSPGSPRSDGRENRSIERSASLVLAARPRNIDPVSRAIQDVTRAHGGFVVSSSVSSSSDGGGGDFELRIPTRNLDDAMTALSRLGAVRERADRSRDITAETVSARSRLKDAKTERTSLLEQLANATTVQETASIRARLSLVSREIERARAEVRRVNNRAAFSTVRVTLVADRSAAAPGTEDDGSWTPGDAASDALRVLEVIAGVALIALAIAIPIGLLLLLAAAVMRVARRRRREHALDAV